MSNRKNYKKNPYKNPSRPCNSKTLRTSHENKTSKLLCEKEQDVIRQRLKVNIRNTKIKVRI